MARMIQIEVDTNLNYCRITDLDNVSNEIYHEYYGALGWGFSYQRKNSTSPLTDTKASIRFETPIGRTMFFKIDQLDSFTVDGTPQVQANFDALVTNLNQYIFV
jgi:hypothetical protein